MSDLDTKSLKKLADVCRKAGIKSFKNGQFEFTLTDSIPESNYKKAKKAAVSISDSPIDDDSLTQDQILFYSALDPLAPKENE